MVKSNCIADIAMKCDVIINNLQRKSKKDGGIWKNSSNQEVSVLTPYVYHCSFRNYRLAKVSFIHCFYIVVGIFCQPAYKNNRKTQNLMTYNSKISEDRCQVEKKMLRFWCLFRYWCQFFSLRQKLLLFLICLQTLKIIIRTTACIPYEL